MSFAQMSEDQCTQLGAWLAGALLGSKSQTKPEEPMAGVLKKPPRKPKQKPFTPTRSSKIQVIEDDEASKNGHVMHPGLTSTTTPAGIAAHDPDAIPPTFKPEPGRYAQLDLADIDPSPTNPRKHFDQEKLEQLAESIRSEGIVEPLIVRAVGKRYELVAGERRWRAAKLAGLASVPAIIRTLSDSQALVIQVIENLQRDNLSAIEEADGFRRLLAPVEKGGAGYSQTKLAEELGCTQAHISNRVRLLELPKDWQQRVITGEIPPTHARSLVPWIEFPAVLKAIQESLKYNGVGTAHDFDDDVRRAAHHHSRALQGTEYNYKVHAQVPIFTPTDEQRAQLQIVEVPGFDRKARPEPRAFNVKLWEKLQERHASAYLAKRDKADDRKSKKAGQPEKKLTPAQEKAKQKKLSEQFARRLDEWRADWYRILVAEKLTARHWVTYKLALYFLAGGTENQAMKHRQRAEDLQEVLELLGTKTAKIRGSMGYTGFDTAQIWTMFARESEQVPELIVRLLREWLVDHIDGPVAFVPLDVLKGLRADLQIDLAAEWKKNCAGKLTEAYFRLHTTEQLHKLARELGLDTTPNDKKGALVDALTAAQGTPLPRELEA